MHLLFLVIEQLLIANCPIACDMSMELMFDIPAVVYTPVVRWTLYIYNIIFPTTIVYIYIYYIIHFIYALLYLYIYRIAGKFGGGKFWRIG